MQFQDAIRSGFRNYVNFSGRAARSEYWYWFLFACLVNAVAAILDYGIFPYSDIAPLQTISGIVLLLPGIAVAARRMHDMDRTAWWLLLALTVVGAVILLVWFCFKGTEGPNRFGPDPLTAA
jgi:uncharacterized membrane protein YhaH (DUF805 family)